MRLRRPDSRSKASFAFSLVEIALALGVVGFALVAILGMVPVAVESARVAREETRATFIARSILETLQSGEKGKAVIETGSGSFTTVDMPPASPVTRHLAYDSEGKLLGEATGYNEQTGTNAPTGSTFIASLRLTPQPGKPVHVSCRVETPANAAAANRKSYPFVTLLAP